MQVSLAVVGSSIRVRAPFELKERCKALPGARWNASSKTWDVPATPSAARSIVEKFDDIARIGDQSFESLLDQSDRQLAASIHKTADNLEDVPCSLTEAWEHQRRAFWFTREQEAGGLFMDMGTGKSKVAVDLCNAWEAETILIVGPDKAVRVWPAQFRQHSCRAIDTIELSTKSVRGTARKKATAEEALKRAQESRYPIAIAVNYESLWREPFASWVLSVNWDVIILDESHKIKAPGGRQSKFASRLFAHSKHRLCLTGTPMPHSPLDIYAQYRFLDPGIFGKSFTTFKHRYAVFGGFENKQVIEYKNLDELHDKMFSIGFQVSADVLDLPDSQHLPLTTDLEPQGRAVYKELDENLVARIEDGEVTVANALVELLRLQQVTSGHIKTDEGEVVEVGHEKEKLLEDLLDDLPQTIDGFEPVVVFTKFVHDLDVVRRLAEKTHRRYGEVSGRENDLSEDATFPDDVDILGVQIQSGGTGIDLTRARYGVYYSVGFSLGDFEQSLKRLDRPGQTRNPIFYYLIVNNTVDIKVYKALENRKEIVDFVMAGGILSETDDEL